MSWVYFLQPHGGGPVKIGFTSRSPESRVLGVASEMRGSGDQFSALNCIGLIHCLGAAEAKNLESEMHRRFEDSRLEGEWFDPSPELLVFIGSLRTETPLLPAWLKSDGMRYLAVSRETEMDTRLLCELQLRYSWINDEVNLQSRRDEAQRTVSHFWNDGRL